MECAQPVADFVNGRPSSVSSLYAVSMYMPMGCRDTYTALFRSNDSSHPCALSRLEKAFATMGCLARLVAQNDRRAMV